jgi:hypothetical protein
MWGGEKAENALIYTETDDSCIVGFGGSFTDDRVDAELMDTCEGDEQAVKKTIQFLVL